MNAKTWIRFCNFIRLTMQIAVPLRIDHKRSRPTVMAALNIVKETTGSGERQTRIQKLASRGMSTKQISEELKTPLGEVELILSLQKNTEN